MQKCTHCSTAAATVHVLDVASYEVVRSQSLCEGCAAELGILASKAHLAKGFSKELLQNLIGGLKGTASPGAAPAGTVCPGCQTTLSEFRLRGRFGCPRCYEVFRAHVVPLLERVHDAVTHRGRCPGRPARKAPDPVDVSALRRRLEDAIANERYEEAAELRDRLRRLGRPPERSEP